MMGNVNSNDSIAVEDNGRPSSHSRGDTPSSHSSVEGASSHSPFTSPPPHPVFQSLPPFVNHTRRKRSAVDPKKTTCMLYLQADHLFYERIGSEEACIEAITRHVQRVNSIYKVTDFDRDGEPDNIRFMIKRVKIHNQNALSDPGYRFPNNYGVEKFLELFSEEDYDSFCLAYMFTYRDFEGGTLGLAWTGDLKNAGGVCEKNGHYRGSLKSLNTGIVTLLNYGKHVPPAVSHVTLAHEIGHNFGSPHDPEHDTTCTPGGEDGNYIMFARATSGDKFNNNKFSPCSLKKINSVLNSKARDTKGCFTMPQASICGNGVVEAGEECDCGWEEDCEDQCCFPMTSNPRPGEEPCTLRPGRTCSPSQGPCCTHTCTLKIGDKCRDDNGCRDTAFCDGMGPQCPPSVNKPNKTICNSEFVCYRGECTGSICLAYGLESCQCKRYPGDPDTKSCELCCKLPGEDQPCLSSFDWNTYPYNIPDMYAKAGTPCDEYKGYCDVFKKCREVDPYGPLATLRKLLLSDESLASLQEWLQQHWWAVTLLLLAILVLLIVIVRVFGRRAGGWKKKKRRASKSGSRKHKKKTVFHKNTPGLASQYPILSSGAAGGHEGAIGGPQHVVHPTVVRANLPFKRRVNEVKRAATKAKRAAKSTLTRPRKKTVGVNGAKRGIDPFAVKGSHGKRTTDKALKRNSQKNTQEMPVLSPTESEQSGVIPNTPVDTAATLGPNGATTVHATVTVAIPSTSAAAGGTAAAAGTKPKQKDSLSSRFSIISFKTFRPKSLSPDKYKITITDKRKVKDDKRAKSKKSDKTCSPDKGKRDGEAKASGAVAEKSRRNRSPSKRATMEDDRRRSRTRGMSSHSPDKARRQTLPNSDMSRLRGKCGGSSEKQQQQQAKLPTANEGNWLIQKFLADEERIGKRGAEGSLRGSVTSINALINGSCNGSPVLSHNRHGSTRALIPPDSNVMASPIRGIINEAFVSSPRGVRTHSSLRVTKSVTPDDEDENMQDFSNKYRRSISMEAYSQGCKIASPDKRKRSRKDEGLGSDKKRRFSSPEKNKPNVTLRRYEFGDNMAPSGRNSVSPFSSRTGSSHSTSDSHDRGGGREKLSVVTATTGGSVVSVMEPTEILETASLQSANKHILETSSLGSSGKGNLETLSSVHSNSRGGAGDCQDSSSLHSKGLPDTSSLHSSGKSLLLDSSSLASRSEPGSREVLPPEETPPPTVTQIQSSSSTCLSKTPKDWV